MSALSNGRICESQNCPLLNCPSPPAAPAAALSPEQFRARALRVVELLLQKHRGGILDKLLDGFQEGYRLTAINQAMVVGQSDVHHVANDNLAVDGNRALEDAVHAEDAGLGWVDDGSAHERAKDAAVADGKGATIHVLNRKIAVARLEAEVGELALDIDKAHLFDVAENRNNQALGGSNGNRNVDIVVVDNVIAINESIDGGDELKGLRRGLAEGGHEAELDAMLLQHVILVAGAEGHDVGHVNLVESGEHGSNVLGLLEALGSALAHARHLGASDTAKEGGISGLGGGLWRGRLGRSGLGRLGLG
eukprot:m.56840 g.56840  ORF g.56840 m.56840 type:complete len:307 (+) comp7036_c0_seq1:1183-2103(+)